MVHRKLRIPSLMGNRGNGHLLRSPHRPLRLWCRLQRLDPTRATHRPSPPHRRQTASHKQPNRLRPGRRTSSVPPSNATSSPTPPCTKRCASDSPCPSPPRQPAPTFSDDTNPNMTSRPWPQTPTPFSTFSSPPLHPPRPSTTPFLPSSTHSSIATSSCPAYSTYSRAYTNAPTPIDGLVAWAINVLGNKPEARWEDMLM